VPPRRFRRTYLAGVALRNRLEEVERPPNAAAICGQKLPIRDAGIVTDRLAV